MPQPNDLSRSLVALDTKSVIFRALAPRRPALGGGRISPRHWSNLGRRGFGGIAPEPGVRPTSCAAPLYGGGRIAYTSIAMPRIAMT
jgi:hypothetical protein